MYQFYGNVYIRYFSKRHFSRRVKTTDYRDGRRREQRAGKLHADVPAGRAIVQE